MGTCKYTSPEERIAPKPEELTLKERLAWIFANRKETADGRPMTENNLSLAAGLARSHVWQLLNEPNRNGCRAKTGVAIAWAAQVSLNWFATGRGSPNDPGIPLRPEPRTRRPKGYRTWGQVPGWQRCLEQTFLLEWPIDPPQAILAGANLPIEPWGLPGRRLTPEAVRAVCQFAYHLAPKERKAEFFDRWVRVSQSALATADS